jgi:hypothetical protein
MMKNRTELIRKVWVLRTAVGTGLSKVRVMVPAPALFRTFVIFRRIPLLIPELMNSIVSPSTKALMLWVAAATVAVVVDPPFAV